MVRNGSGVRPEGETDRKDNANVARQKDAKAELAAKMKAKIEAKGKGK